MAHSFASFLRRQVEDSVTKNTMGTLDTNESEGVLYFLIGVYRNYWVPDTKEAAAEPSNRIHLSKPLTLPFEVAGMSNRVYRRNFALQTCNYDSQTRMRPSSLRSNVRYVVYDGCKALSGKNLLSPLQFNL
jgi:hypothetical protein